MILLYSMCRTLARHLQSELYNYVHAIHVMYISFACSRFTLIVDNTDPLLESRDFLDQQMVSDIVGRHTVKHQYSITDILLSSSDFEQVRTHVKVK